MSRRAGRCWWTRRVGGVSIRIVRVQASRETWEVANRACSRLGSSDEDAASHGTTLLLQRLEASSIQRTMTELRLRDNKMSVLRNVSSYMLVQ